MLKPWTKAVINPLTLGLGLVLLVSTDFTIAQTPPPPSPTARPRATVITEAEVRAVLDQIIAASRRQDSDAMLQFLAPNATIDLTVRTVAGSRKLTLTRQQYADYLKQGLAAIEQHQSKYSGIKVRIAPDGKTATATYTVQESSRLRNQAVAIASVSNETVTFQRIQGQLQATTLRAIARVEFK